MFFISSLVNIPTEGDPMKETIVSSTNPKASLILPVGEFTIMCEIWDKFGTYFEEVVGTVTVSREGQQK